MIYCVAKMPGESPVMGVKSDGSLMEVKFNPLVVPDIDGGNPSIELLRSSETSSWTYGS
jgi:hypothetical protein